MSRARCVFPGRIDRWLCAFRSGPIVGCGVVIVYVVFIDSYVVLLLPRAVIVLLTIVAGF
jgi:hypothetical protein